MGGLGDGDVGLVGDEIIVGLGEEGGEERGDVDGEGREDDGGQELERSQRSIGAGGIVYVRCQGPI